MRVLVVGMSKTGTSGLCYRIAGAMESKPHILDEPGSIREGDLAHENIVVKMLTNPGTKRKAAIFADESFERHFDKKVMIVRDPRDTIISRVLYQAAFHVIWEWDASRITAYLDLLRRKEQNPRSVSMLSLFNDILAPRSIYDGFESIVQFSRTRGTAYFCVRYEDFVRNKLEGLEEYLGIGLGRNSEVVLPKSRQRVARSKASGQWRSWFTEEDIRFFKPSILPYMKELGYQCDDWKLHARPSILPIHASVYVEKVMDERRMAAIASKAAAKRKNTVE